MYMCIYTYIYICIYIHIYIYCIRTYISTYIYVNMPWPKRVCSASSAAKEPKNIREAKVAAGGVSKEPVSCVEMFDWDEAWSSKTHATKHTLEIKQGTDRQPTLIALPPPQPDAELIPILDGSTVNGAEGNDGEHVAEEALSKKLMKKVWQCNNEQLKQLQDITPASSIS